MNKVVEVEVVEVEVVEANLKIYNRRIREFLQTQKKGKEYQRSRD